MLTLELLCISIALCVCYATGESVPLSEDQKQFSVELHNDYRKKEGASNMNKMVWCEECANVAAGWISKCNFDHMRKDFGENLFYSTMVPDINKGIEEALHDWFEEKYLPGGTSRSCGQKCHYTQMVWAKTKEVGCAVEKCGTLWAFGRGVRDATYIACFYTPKGNWMGQPTYLTGPACSKCDPGQGCSDGLCSGTGAPKEGTPSTNAVSCVDHYPMCHVWSIVGECKVNPNFMKVQCAKSCGICKGDGKSNAACLDSSPDCRGWAVMGECDVNPKYMKTQCMASCGLC